MRYAVIEDCEITNGNGIGVSLYTQGCPIKCKGCFNPETWNFNGGKEFVWGEHDREILKLLNKSYITRFSVLGGEPLIYSNLPTLLELLRSVKYSFPHIKIWIWTGYTYEQLLERKNDYIDTILAFFCNYLIAGPYVQEERDLTLLWRGSRNQEVIDMKETIRQGEKILYVQ